MEIGDRVRVTKSGTFYGYVGVISRIKQHSKVSQRYYWVVFDDHPWQKPDVDWAFVKRELEDEE